MFEADVLDVAQHAFTGDLPTEPRVGELIDEAHRRYAGLHDGRVADYIPILAEADPNWFGLTLAGTNDRTHSAGDTGLAFSIRSISKAFVFALVYEAYGHQAVHERVGVNNTRLPFNSVMAVELNGGSPMNPMVNAGAIATTALMPGATPAAGRAKSPHPTDAATGRRPGNRDDHRYSRRQRE
ncbi:glutaminase [Nocardia flavorosea]|uniref:glutaminase n=1 Tax=Nocardia flavorosea TaxID=53429 RepID=A0A846YR96_9NOCA|nr:glutaminase [Nocardia flavorosea]NKY60090.1 hypothetical protein [Nocardia flavorosea]